MSNEAAERLDRSMARMRLERDALCATERAAERKATVERIRAALMASRLRHGPDDDGGFWPYSSVVAVLDAEAER